MKKYEFVVLLVPELSQEKVEGILKKVRGIIANHKGTILTEDHWGLRKLAYRIGKRIQGIYHFMKFAAEPGVVADIRRMMSVTDDVMRHSVVRIDVEPKQPRVRRTSSAPAANPVPQQPPTGAVPPAA
jgi:small subunit ribosomal protein S6